MRHPDVPEEPNEAARAVVEAALKVHRALGPGLLAPVYEHCLAHGLSQAGRRAQRQVPQRLMYAGQWLDKAYRLDLVVDDAVVVEVKALDALHPRHFAQLRSYLRLSGFPVGLLINFGAPRLKDGLHRLVHTQ